jgi:Na+/melibiose symporter-like transporter
MAAIEQHVRTSGRGQAVLLRSAYGAGHFAKSLAWTFTDLLLAYYANVRMGLSAGETGLLLFLSMAYGAGLDVAMAYILRRAEGSRRRILQIQFAAALATAAALMVVFTPPLGAITPFLYLTLTLAMLRTAYAVYDVSQNALVSLLPRDEADAHQYVVWRQVLSALARLSVAALAFLIVGQGTPAGREIVVVAVIAVLIAATASWILAWTGPMRAIPANPATVGLKTPRGITRLLLAAAAQAGPLSMTARMVTFVERAGPGDHTGAALLFALVLGTLVGPMVITRLKTDDGVLRPAIGFTALAIVAGALFLANPWSGLPALAACCAHGVGLGGVMTLFWRGMSASIRDHARLTGERTDLAAFALLTATLKLSAAVFGGAVGFALDGFRAGDPATLAMLSVVTAIGGVGFVVMIAPARRREGRV